MRSRRLRISPGDYVSLFSRFSLYLHAGIPIIEAVDLLVADSCNKSERKLLEAARIVLQEGLPFSEVFVQFPYCIQPLYLQLIRVGEASGKLADSLSRISELFEQRKRLGQKILAAVAYPVAVLAGTMGLSAFLVLYTFPKITPLFRGMHLALPFTTRSLIWISGYIATDWPILCVCLALCVFVVVTAFRSARGREIFERIALGAPFWGRCVHAYCLSVFFGTFATLLRSGIRIDRSLSYAGSSIPHSRYRAAVAAIEREVLAGNTCSQGMRQFPELFEYTAIQILVAGERTGTLPQSAALLAELHRTSLEAKIARIVSWIEPLLMVCMGVIVGYVALAIISPMYGLTQGLNPSL